jgi:hypothetical protein
MDWEGAFPDDFGMEGTPAEMFPIDESSVDLVDEPDTLEPTWWVLDREPGMDDLAGEAGDILKTMQDKLKIYPFQDRDGNDRLFLGRFEFPKYDEDFQFDEAIFAEDSTTVVGWIDYLAGFPVDDVEMLVAIGEYSSQVKEGEDSKVAVKDGEDKAAAPVPEKFFSWPETDHVLFSLTAIATKNVGKILAPNLEGEDKPAKAHWWFRVNLAEDTDNPKKWPVPGEFLGLGVRMMPDKPWGHQKSSPFVWSGNWMDTVYYAGGRITEVIDPTDDKPYPTYKVKWRKDEVTATPSDFAEYKVDDRVTILKDVATEKKTQLWKDGDVKFYGGAEDMAPEDIVWQIVPITFYGLEKEA